MKGKDFKIPIIIALIYWIPSSIALFDTIKGSGTIFPLWLDTILLPGYILGFTLGYVSGNFWALVGQLITLIILFSLVNTLHKTYKKKNKARKHNKL